MIIREKPKMGGKRILVPENTGERKSTSALSTKNQKNERTNHLPPVFETNHLVVDQTWTTIRTSCA